MRPHRRQPTRLPHPWDSPGKNTGVGCHFLLQCMKLKSESEVTQSCPTLRDPMDCSLPDSSVHGIFQARVLEWGAIAFSAPCNWRVVNLTTHWIQDPVGSLPWAIPSRTSSGARFCFLPNAWLLLRIVEILLHIHGKQLQTLSPVPRTKLWERSGVVLVPPRGPLGLHGVETHADDFSRCNRIPSALWQLLFSLTNTWGMSF